MLSADHLTLAAWALEIILTVYTASIFFIAIPSVFQERRIWKSPLLPSLSFFGHVRVYIFNVMWMSITLSGGLLLLPKFFVGKIFGFDCQYEAYLVEQITAEMCFSMCVGWKPEIRGVENLPPDDGCAPAPVYVANHASQIDLAAFYFLGRRFKWISKDSVKWLPGVGLIMSLSQHVFIQRTGKNKKSVSNLYQQSNNAIQAGRPMFFFPQGTRRMAVRLPFKDGAYKVALENESLLVPIT
jgi:lysophosphatidate acyltransferase